MKDYLQTIHIQQDDYYFIEIQHSSTINDNFTLVINKHRWSIPVFYNQHQGPPFQHVEYLLGFLEKGEYSLHLSLRDTSYHNNQQNVWLEKIRILARKDLAPKCIPIQPYLSNPKSNPAEYLPNNRYVVIGNYAAGWGGFWYIINRLTRDICAIKRYGLIPIIDFRGGLYYSNKYNDPKCIKESLSWFNYYFIDPSSLSLERKMELISGPKTRFALKQLNKRKKRPLELVSCPETNCYYYGWNSSIRYNLGEINPFGILEIQPYIKQHLEQFWEDKCSIWKNKTLVSIHYRGTDKVASNQCHEDHPTHPRYSDVLSKVFGGINVERADICLLLASDEQPFLDYCQKEHPCCIYFDYPLRSNYSTEGLETRVYNEAEIANLKEQSIHFGHPQFSNYEKGLLAIFDALLLAKGDHLFLSKGNFSQTIKYINHRYSK